MGILIHANGADGRVHCHGCADHPNGGKFSPIACAWDEHDDTFKSKHKDKAITGLTQQHQNETHPDHKARIKKALARI